MKPQQENNNLLAFNLPILGLKKGVTQLDYTLDRTFFASFAHSPIRKAKVKVRLWVDKKETLLVLTLALKGKVKTECDRCLDPFLMPIKGKQKIYIKYYTGIEPPRENDPDIIYITPAIHHYNIAQILYEAVVLAIPLQHIHPDDEWGQSTCNPNMLAILQNMQAQDEPPINDQEPPIDPRWEALKNCNIDKK